MQRGGRGGIRLWALSVNHTALPRRRHLSPNTKGSAPQGTLKPISSLTCNPSRSRKNRIVESYHIHFLCERGCSEEHRTAGTKVVWRDFGICPWKALPPLTPSFFSKWQMMPCTGKLLLFSTCWISCFAACFTAAWTFGSYVNLITSLVSTPSSGVMEWNILLLLFLLNNSENWSMGSQHLPPAFPKRCV